MTTPTTPFTFSYIVVDQLLKDKQGQHVLGVYTFLTKNEDDQPVKILQSSNPAIMVKIYAGNPYPDFDYTHAIERRIKQDIQKRSNYGTLAAQEINANDWHLESQSA